MSTWFLPNYLAYADKVVEFNEIASMGVVISTAATRGLQKSLILEEFDELCYAYSERDKENFLKELCDLFVVSSFMIYLQNKDDYYTEDCFVFNKKCSAPPIAMSLGIIADNIELEDWRSVVKTTLGLLSIIDANAELALKLVTENNISKFKRYEESEINTYDEMAKTIEENSKGRYAKVQWSKVNSWVVFRDGARKILKPTDYKAVDLSICIEE